MLIEFRQRYPKGSLISELVKVEHGQYIVRVAVTSEGHTLATALSASNNIEEAEDRAIKRALSLLDLTSTNIVPEEKLKAVKTQTIAAKTTPPPANNGASKVAAVETVSNSSKSMENGVSKVAAVETVSNSSKSMEVASNAVPVALETPITTTIETSEMITLITMELNRIGWKVEQGREYLLATYGKKSRHMLTDEELSDFLQHLQSQPTATSSEV